MELETNKVYDYEDARGNDAEVPDTAHQISTGL